MKEKEQITITDGPLRSGMFKRGSTIFKAKKHRGVQITFEEIDLEEYDERVDALAKRIAACPGVDLLATLKDALYDLPLDALEAIEKKLKAELEKPSPVVETKADITYRGTCVQLNIGGKNLVELRH